MSVFLRELDLPRPPALVGGVVYAWQGDLLPFVYPGHYAYITTWPFFALAAWGALRSQRLGHWAYALVSGASCGLMVGMQPDRGAIASLLIAVFFLAPAWRPGPERLAALRHLAICAGSALLIALAPFLALFQSNIVGVKLGGEADREKTFNLVTQYSLGPDETLTYLIPGAFGWFVGSHDAEYWGWIGESQNWPKEFREFQGWGQTDESANWLQEHARDRNSNLAISTTGTVATVLALLGAFLLLPEPLAGFFGPADISPRQRLYGRILLVLTLVLSWGWHTPFYRPLFALPLMDKWRNPLKWLEMTNFALAVLSAYGMRHLILSLDEGAKAIRRGLFWFTTAMLALLVILLLASYPFTLILRGQLQLEGYDPQDLVNIVATVHKACFLAVLLMTLFCVVLYGLWRPDSLRQWKVPNPLLDRIRASSLRPENLPLTLAVLMIVLIVSQMGWVAGKFLLPYRLSSLTETNPLLEALRSEGDRVRVSVATQDVVLNIMLQNQFAADHISCLEISAASRVPDDLQAFFEAFGEDRARLWFLTGVKNVAVPEEFMPQLQHDAQLKPNIALAAGYTLTPTPSPDVPSHALIGLRDYMQKATFVPDADFFSTQEDILQHLTDPKWNPRSSVLLNSLESVVTPTMAPDAVPLPARTDLKVYTANQIVVELWAPEPGYLLINDQYDPDWSAQVNGQNTDILKADGLLRAVRVPAGYSSVTMNYASRYHYGTILRQLTGVDLGDLAVSAAWLNNFCDAVMLASWIVAGAMLWRREKTPQTGEPEAPSGE
jgi:hypothetical protein